MPVQEVNKAIQSMLATLPSIEQLKLEQQERTRHVIAGKDVVALLPAGLFIVHIIPGKLHQADTWYMSQPNVSDSVKPDPIV